MICDHFLANRYLISRLLILVCNRVCSATSFRAALIKLLIIIISVTHHNSKQQICTAVTKVLL